MKYTKLLWILWGALILAACDDETPLEQDTAPIVSFGDTLMQVYENEGQQTLKVNLSVPAPSELTIPILVKSEINVQEGKDYILEEKEVHFAQGESSATIHYTLKDDRIVNQDRSFELELTPAKGINKDTKMGVCHVDILDDEGEASVIFDPTLFTVLEADATYYIPMKLVGTPSGEVTATIEVIDSTAQKGTHFRLKKTEYVLTEEGFKGIPVTIINDDKSNVNRLFSVRIVSVTGASRITAKSICTVTIQDDDLGIYFGRATMNAEEREGIVKVPVKLTSTSDKDVTFTVACAGSAQEGTDYTLTKSWTIPAGKDSMDFEVNLNHIEGVNPDRNIEFTFKNLTEGVKIFEETPKCELNIWDCDTKVSFVNSTILEFDKAENLAIPVQLESAVDHDVTLRVRLNSLIGIEHDDITLTSNVTIPKGETTANAMIKLKKSIGRDRIYVKVNLSDTYGATENEDICQINKCYTYSKGELTIASFKTQEAGGEGPVNGYATAAVDGDPNTFWHSVWSSGSAELPEGIVVALPDNVSIIALDVVRRVATGNSDNKTAEIYLSDNISEFTADGWGESKATLQWENKKTNIVADHTATAIFSQPLKGKYMKIMITEGYRANAQIGEVYVYGWEE